MRKLSFTIAILAALLGAPQLAFSQATLADGEVRRIDEAGGKITLKHGPIKHLDMDSMTMAWRVKDPAMLKGLKVGDKVKFHADRVDGSLTVLEIRKAK
jgi:Cu/Ag efflux protein CusF